MLHLEIWALGHLSISRTQLMAHAPDNVIKSHPRDLGPNIGFAEPEFGRDKLLIDHSAPGSILAEFSSDVPFSYTDATPSPPLLTLD